MRNPRRSLSYTKIVRILLDIRDQQTIANEYSISRQTIVNLKRDFKLPPMVGESELARLTAWHDHVKEHRRSWHKEWMGMLDAIAFELDNARRRAGR